MNLPHNLQQVLDEARDTIQKHPAGELTQAKRRIIYDALWSESERTCKWAAILTARRVQPIYEANWSNLTLEPASNFLRSPSPDMRLIIRSTANGLLSTLENLYYQAPTTHRVYAQRMLDIAEDVMLGLLIAKYAKDASNGYYYEIMTQMIRNEPWNAYFALWAAHQALCTVAGYKPLEHRIARPEPKLDGSQSLVSSDQWDDLSLVQDGGYAADFAVYAAFASADTPGSTRYPAENMRRFWMGWLAETIPQAWSKANET